MLITIPQHDGNVPGNFLFPSSANNIVTSTSLGFNSFLSRFPFDGVGIAVLTNDDKLGSSISLAVKYRLADQALKLSPLDSKTM